MFALVLQASEKLVRAFGGLGQIVAGQSDFERSGADAKIVGVDGSVEQIRERALFHFKLAVLAGNIFFDEFDGAFVVVNGALHEELGLLLRGHGGEAFDFVAGEFCGRGREGIALQLNDAFEFGPGGFNGGRVGGGENQESEANGQNDEKALSEAGVRRADFFWRNRLILNLFVLHGDTSTPGIMLNWRWAAGNSTTGATAASRVMYTFSRGIRVIHV